MYDFNLVMSCIPGDNANVKRVCIATILCSGQKGAFYWLLFSFNRAEAFS